MGHSEKCYVATKERRQLLFEQFIIENYSAEKNTFSSNQLENILIRAIIQIFLKPE